jgi:hypothetical protein
VYKIFSKVLLQLLKMKQKTLWHYVKQHLARTIILWNPLKKIYAWMVLDKTWTLATNTKCLNNFSKKIYHFLSCCNLRWLQLWECFVCFEFIKSRSLWFFFLNFPFNDFKRSKLTLKANAHGVYFWHQHTYQLLLIAHWFYAWSLKQIARSFHCYTATL